MQHYGHEIVNAKHEKHPTLVKNNEMTNHGVAFTRDEPYGEPCRIGRKSGIAARLAREPKHHDKHKLLP